MARRKKNPLTGGAMVTVAAMTAVGAAWGFLLGKVQQTAERVLMAWNFGRTEDVDPEDVAYIVVKATRDGLDGPLLLLVTEDNHAAVEYELPNTVTIPTLTNLLVIFDDDVVPASIDTVGTIEFVDNTPTHYYFKVDDIGSVRISVLDERSDQEATFVVNAA